MIVLLLDLIVLRSCNSERYTLYSSSVIMKQIRYFTLILRNIMYEQVNGTMQCNGYGIPIPYMCDYDPTRTHWSLGVKNWV